MRKNLCYVGKFLFSLPKGLNSLRGELSVASFFPAKICIAAQLIFPLSCFLDEHYLYQCNDLQILAKKKRRDSLGNKLWVAGKKTLNARLPKIPINASEWKPNVAVAYLWLEFGCCGSLCLWDADVHLSPGFCSVFGVLWNCSSQRSVVRDVPARKQAQSGTATRFVPGIQKWGGFASKQCLLFQFLMCGSYSLAAFNPCDWMLCVSDKALTSCPGKRLGCEKWPV